MWQMRAANKERLKALVFEAKEVVVEVVKEEVVEVVVEKSIKGKGKKKEEQI